MKLVNTNNEISIDPTPKLKSSPIPIKFISFNSKDINCVYCGEKYIEALLCPSTLFNYYDYYEQKYCKKCLTSYINNITDNNIYLDVYFDTMDFCDEHEINTRTNVPQNIQECCGNCLRILCFKQMRGSLKWSYSFDDIHNKVIESEKECKFCGKTLYQGIHERIVNQLKLCSDCYLISSGLIESTLTEKQISILYLPWWHNSSFCDACHSKLIFTSDCQKYCTNCLIFYIGCRYCLMTNIIFGPTAGHSQCKKCKRTSFLTNSSLKSDIDDFLLHNVIFDNLDKLKIQIKSANTMKNINKYFMPRNILDSIFKEKSNKNIIKWIPYSQFTDVKEITRGGHGIVYKATWLDINETVILKRFENSENIKYFLNELKSFGDCLEYFDNNIIKIYGFTKDPELGDYILIMEYASEGDLHKYLQKNFINITWNRQKLYILWEISNGLRNIHKKDFIHRDFHSGNILFDLTNGECREGYQWKVADLGLSQSLHNTSSNSEIYGVIPYIAPEVFKGSTFSKEADIYSFGMIMWELTTGCKPFAHVEHDINLIYKILDGERPKISEDTPECYSNLMRRCWDPDPKERPSIECIFSNFGDWAFGIMCNEQFNQAEIKRMGHIQSKKMGPEFTEKRHPKAIYTSRPLSALISECSSINSLSISFGDEQDYNYVSKEQTFDIDIKSSSQNLTIQSPLTTLKKRNIKELNHITHDNSGKRIKTD
ncbi:hypothetical protein RclHR1_01740030 [Rhizophagus clarus]|uniref:Kinase-like domain-containing protein n=1 Tax=Rhizophagus clarus TaxID=94130 RepID=A0A2Z6QK07_9GLOM|nr:hypothetical protein RclHR1_01740030 [Rhizophagus clarus]GES81769.1 kinase-like domain-containing protein [Rhizophagus clarus]